MKHSSESGFTMVELVVATGALLVVLSGALFFFSRGQSIYTNERATLDMVQDLRMAFDRFTDEIRMSGAGLPSEFGVISGDSNTLVVRGDFGNITTLVLSKGSSSTIFKVGTTQGFSAGQTVSIYSIDTSRSLLAVLTAVDPTTNTITVDPGDIETLNSSSSLDDMGPGSVLNVIERRSYTVVTEGTDKGSVKRKIAYDTIGSTVGAVLTDEVIARNVLTPDGQAGLSFTYFDRGNTKLIGAFDPADVYKVQINLSARTAERDLQSGQYRTLNLTSLVQVRNMYQQ